MEPRTCQDPRLAKWYLNLPNTHITLFMDKSFMNVITIIFLCMAVSDSRIDVEYCMNLVPSIGSMEAELRHNRQKNRTVYLVDLGTFNFTIQITQ